MKSLAITGLSGVIGTALLSDPSLIPGYHMYDLYHQHRYRGNPVIKKHVALNLLQTNQIARVLESVKPDRILHMAAITHIDACEIDKKNGKNGIVWKTNVDGTREIAAFCKKHHVPITYISTECVFDGKQEFYDEDSQKNPLNWYGRTKSEAEDIILSSNSRATVIRAVMVYHKQDNGKTLFGKIHSGLKNSLAIQAVSDQFITPTYTYDVTQTIRHVLSHEAVGVYHVSSNQATTPFEFAELIATTHGYSPSYVQNVSLETFYGRQRAALRLRHACLRSKKLPPAKSPHTVMTIVE